MITVVLGAPIYILYCAGCGAQRHSPVWRIKMFCNRDCEAKHNVDGPHPRWRQAVSGLS